MGSAVGKIALGAAIVGAAFVTGGAALLPAISTAGVAGGVGAVSIGAALSTTALGSTLLLAGGGLVLQGVAGAAGLGPKAPASTLSALDRLNATLVPSAARKAVYGYGALATDIRYVEPSGENQEYIDYIIAVAAHRATSITGIFFEDLQAWSADTGVTEKYAGYLTVETRLEGTAANAVIINGGEKWGANRRLAGCAYVHIRIKRTGNSKKAESPLAAGLPSRVTITGAGMPVYDPRYDSTVTGGSGPQRADDQSTWAYDYAGGNQGSNPALQTLAHLLGWRINGKLSVGNGVPPARIDLASFGIAASLCYEGVTKVDGSVISRYVGAGVISEADEPQGVLTSLATSCNARLRDSGGKLSLVVMHNDLAAAAADDGLNDDHVLSGFEWRPDISLDQTYNIVRGRFCDPSANSLYQLVDYPEVSLPSIDGIDRILPLDLPWVDDASRAQRIAKQVLQRRQYPGAFSATFGPEAWRYQVGDVLPLTFSALGFNRKLFRVAEQTPGLPDGTCPMVLTVEHPSIYAWDRDESPAVQAAEPIRYDPLNNPVILGIEQASETALWTKVGDDGGKPEDYATDGAVVDPTAPHGRLFRSNGVALALEEILNTPSFEEVTGRDPQDVIADFDLTQLQLAEELLRGEISRRSVQEDIRDENGVLTKVLVEGLAGTINGHEVFIGSLQSVDSEGNGKSVNTININGHVTGTTNTLTGEESAYYILTDEFGVVDPDDADSVRAPFLFVNGVLYLDHAKVRLLDAGVVYAENIVSQEVTKTESATTAAMFTGAGAVPSVTWNDVITYNLHLEYPAEVVVTMQGLQSYTGDADFGADLMVNGVSSAGGVAGGAGLGLGQVSFTGGDTFSLPLGDHQIKMRWRGSAGVKLERGRLIFQTSYNG